MFSVVSVCLLATVLKKYERIAMKFIEGSRVVKEQVIKVDGDPNHDPALVGPEVP